jgi:disulfide bond formation protein DsbB
MLLNLTNYRKISAIIFLLSALPITGALVSQYFFNMHPCELCIYQRIPFFVIMFFSLIAFIKPSLKTCLITTIIAIHALIINAGIAFYHVGVEKNWWVNEGCAGDFDMSSQEALLKTLLEAPIVKCADIQFELFGISMAGYNFLYCAALAIALIILTVKIFKNKKQILVNNED